MKSPQEDLAAVLANVSQDFIRQQTATTTATATATAAATAAAATAAEAAAATPLGQLRVSPVQPDPQNVGFLMDGYQHWWTVRHQHDGTVAAKPTVSEPQTWRRFHIDEQLHCDKKLQNIDSS